MCAKAPPFNAKTHFELIQKIKAGRYPPIPSCYSPELSKVIASCLQVFPTNRPDTAQLLNLPIVKLMRKEQEVVIIGHELRDQKEKLLRQEKELEAKHKALNDQLRREWEVKAQLEIERRVKLEVERRVQAEFKDLHDRFEAEVKLHVEKALRKYPARPSSSPKLEPRSSTPTMPEEQSSVLFPESTEPIMVASTSTVGTNSDFSSATDLSNLSNLSLGDTTEDVTIAAKPAPKRRPRVGLTRAQTMGVPTHTHAPPSPMDVQMAEPSPAPASLAGLSLSPRRNQPRRNNIFSAAKEGVNRWEGEVPPSPTEEEWNADLEEDDVPAPPSPTLRARSASGSRAASADPFKTHATANKPVLKSTRVVNNAPTLAAPSQKSRHASAVPVSTSPSRRNNRNEATSPVRRTAASATQPSGNTGLQLKSKKGNDAFRNQFLRTGVQGRTLVELQQARNIPASDDEGKRGAMRTGGVRSPVKARSATASCEVSDWDPAAELDMLPSPWVKRTSRTMGQVR